MPVWWRQEEKAKLSGVLSFLKDQIKPDDRRLLVIGGDGPEAAGSVSSSDGRETWWLHSSGQNCGRFSREIIGLLLSLGPGTLALKSFDWVVLLGDLPFGSDLIPFFSKLKRLLAPGGKAFLCVQNPCSSLAMQSLFAGEFLLPHSGDFTPAQFRCALAETGFKISQELTAFLPGGTIAGDTNAELASIAEKTFIVNATKPLVGNTKMGESTPGTRTSIVVLTYNSATTLTPCLESIKATISPQDEVIVVDNASADNTCELAAQLLTGINGKLIANSSNLGFSAGCNVGIRAAVGRYIALLNPDTIVYPGWLEGLQAPFQDPAVGMSGPLSDRVAGLQFVANFLGDERISPDALPLICRERFRGQVLETKLLIGFCVMFSREVLREVGMLDEDLFLGSDDLEMSWRLRTHGKKLAITKEVFVSHRGGVSFSSLDSGEKALLLYESTEALLAKVRSYYGWNPPDRLLWGIDITHK